MSDTDGRLIARVYRRTKTFTGGVSDLLIGTFDCLNAQGSAVLGQIGGGELTAITEHVNVAGVQAGDIITVVQESSWKYEPTQPRNVTAPFRICCFIVRNIRNDGNHVTTISGDDMLAELLDYPAVTPIGELTELSVEIAARNYGKRTFLIKTQYATGVTEIVISNADVARVLEDDDIHIKLSNGSVFITSISEVISDDASLRTVNIRLKDALPSASAVPGYGEFVLLFTPRIQVTADKSETFDTGAPIRMMTDDRTAGGLYAIFETRIDGFEELEDDGVTTYFIRLETAPIQSIPVENPRESGTTNLAITSTYDTPTTTDIADLLKNDTFGIWSVFKRDVDCTVGTTYEPAAESVWDALSAMLDTTGYTIKIVKNYSDPTKPDKRQIRIMNPAGTQLLPGTVLEVQAKIEGLTANDGIAAVLSQPRVDIEGEPITHIIPFGAGGGQSRFDMTAADLSLLDPYNRQMNDYEYVLGRRAKFWVLYRARRAGSTAPLLRDVWRTVTFSHIRPISEDNTTNVRAAANQLLKAAVEYLHESYRDNLTIEADVHTYADPQPGDKLPRFYSDLTPGAVISKSDLIMSKVEHSTSGGIRVTKLTLTRNRVAPLSGEMQAAKAIQQFKRYMAQTNAPTSGGASFNGSTLVYPGAVAIGSTTGNVSMRAETGDMQIFSGGRLFITSTNDIRIDNDLVAERTVEAGAGLRLVDQNDVRHTYTVVLLRGIPRRVVTTSYVQGTPGGDEPEEAAFVSPIDGGFY